MEATHAKMVCDDMTYPFRMSGIMNFYFDKVENLKVVLSVQMVLASDQFSGYTSCRSI